MPWCGLAVFVVQRLDGGAQDPGVGGLEDGVEGCGEVPDPRSRISPVARLIAHPADMPAQHRVLVPEHEQLGIFAGSPRNTTMARPSTRAREQVDDLEQHPAS
jgi:hypothetical protein